jgi:hypothetical protein
MRVFISYAWENDEYRALVKRLAARLRDDGIDARLDAWHLEGLTIPEFMSREVRHADKILVVCSPQYRQKVHAMEDGERITGTGWESMLVTSSIWANLTDRKKMTPVLLRGTWQEAAPNILIGLPYFDLSDIATFEANYRDLLRSLTDQNEPVPPLGQMPEITPEPVIPLQGPQKDADTRTNSGARDRTQNGADVVEESAASRKERIALLKWLDRIPDQFDAYFDELWHLGFGKDRLPAGEADRLGERVRELHRFYTRIVQKLPGIFEQTQPGERERSCFDEVFSAFKREATACFQASRTLISGFDAPCTDGSWVPITFSTLYSALEVREHLKILRMATEEILIQFPIDEVEEALPMRKNGPARKNR